MRYGDAVRKWVDMDDEKFTNILAMNFQHRNLPMLLAQTRERVLSRFRPILNAHEITEQQWRIVRALLDTGPLEPHRIVALCGISSPSLAGILSRMEGLGLVTRERVPDDQRRVLVSLTDRSRDLAQRMAPGIEAIYARLGEQVGVERLDRLYAALDELLDLVETVPPRR